MSDYKKASKYTTILIILVALLLALVGVTYAWLTQTLNAEKNNVIRTGNFLLKIQNEGNGINLTGTTAIPMSEEKGKVLDPYVFTVKNEGDIKANYTIYIDNDTSDEEITNFIDDQYIRYSLDADGENMTKLLSNDLKRAIYTGSLDSKATKTFNLRLWIDKDANVDNINNKVFAGKIRIEAIQSSSNIGASNDNPVPTPSS